MTNHRAHPGPQPEQPSNAESPLTLPHVEEGELDDDALEEVAGGQTDHTATEAPPLFPTK